VFMRLGAMFSGETRKRFEGGLRPFP